jgi:hypothetical protein
LYHYEEFVKEFKSVENGTAATTSNGKQSCSARQDHALSLAGTGQSGVTAVMMLGWS